VIYQKLSSTHLTYLSSDICPKNIIYTGIYREIGTFLPILTPFLAPLMPPKQGKCRWYIKSFHLHISPTSHVTYSLKITLLTCFIGRWARFYPFWPPVLPQYTPKQGKFWCYIERYHLHIIPISRVTYSLKITFVPCVIGRWARFYLFWPPVLPQYAQYNHNRIFYYGTYSRKSMLSIDSPYVALILKGKLFIFYLKSQPPLIFSRFKFVCPGIK